jgi:arylsulfatase A-like enzyme
LIHCDPNSAEFQIPGVGLPPEVPPLRLNDRQTLLDQVNQHLDGIARSPAVGGYDVRTQQAFDLLKAGKARRAFQLDEETPAKRDRYGRNRFGQSVLLARRLVEAGVSLVQVNWTRMPGDKDDSPAWDSHNKNSDRLKQNLMTPMDLAYSALLEDLEDRGLLEETLVVWAGEFGRTPKINGGGGRDHWGHVFSVALAGGGVKGGVVHGSSDKIGGHPKEGRVQPQDLAATIFHCLGHDAHTEVTDVQNRPIAISRGEAIRQLF